MNMFKIGDRVRVLDGSSNESYYDGWSQGMYEYVGKICIVRSISGRGVRLEGNVFTWDARYLELVEEKKMENKITIDGKEYELSAELVEKIKAEVEKQEKAEAERLAEQGPFARAICKRYFLINGVGRVSTLAEGASNMDDELYSIANYCTDKSLMEQRALHETLNRLLWRYSEMNGGDSNPWPYGEHWFIYRDTCNSNEMMVLANDSYKMQGIIYFKDRAIAEAAIEEVAKPFMAAHPEFVW